MGLRTKVLAGFLILSLMLAIAGIWSIHELDSMGSSVLRLLDDNYKSINACEGMLESLEREDSAVLLLLLGRLEEGRAILEEAHGAFYKAFQIAEHNLTVPGEAEYVKTIKAQYDSYRESSRALTLRIHAQGGLDWYFQESHVAFLRVKAAVNDLKRINEETLYRTAADLRNRANRAVMPGVVAIVSALVFSLMFSFFVNLFMVGPIVRLTKGVERFMEDRRTFSVEAQSSDEIGKLVKAVSTLCSLLKTAERER